MHHLHRYERQKLFASNWIIHFLFVSFSSGVCVWVFHRMANACVCVLLSYNNAHALKFTLDLKTLYFCGSVKRALDTRDIIKPKQKKTKCQKNNDGGTMAIATRQSNSNTSNRGLHFELKKKDRRPRQRDEHTKLGRKTYLEPNRKILWAGKLPKPICF